MCRTFCRPLVGFFGPILAVLFLPVVLAVRPLSASAADSLWIGDDGFGSSDFNRSGNWQGGQVPPDWSYSNSLKFNQNLRSNVTGLNYDFGDWRAVNDIFWDGTFTVSRTLTASNGGGIGFKIRVENLSSFTQTVAMSLSGGSNGATEIQLNPVNGSLIVSGTIFNDNSKSYTVYGSLSGTTTSLTLNTALGPNATGANVNFNVASGRNTAVQVNASQVWAGTTNVDSGAFTTANGVTLASTAIVVGGGTVATTSANTLADTASLTVNTGRLSIGGSDTVASLAGSGGTVALAAGATLTFGSSGTSSYAGAITGSGNLTKVGSGTFTLSAASSMTGTTTVSVGQFSLGGSNLLADTSAVAVAGGVLALGGNSDTVGAFAISGGSLTGSGTVTAATYRLGGGTVSANLGAGAVTVTGNASLNGTSQGTTLNLTSGTLTLGSAGRLAATTAVAVTGSAGGALALGGNETIGSLAGAAKVALGSSALTVGGDNTSTTYSGGLSGSGLFTKVGSGTLTLAGANSNSGGTTVSAGRLVVTTSSVQGAITNNAAVSFDQATSGTYSGVMGGSGSLTKLGSGTVTLAGNNSYAGGTVVSAGRLVGTTTSLQGDIVNNAAVEIVVPVDNTSFGGAISGSGSLTKSGAGGLLLAGNNTYSGGTVVSAGELLGSTDSLQGAIANSGLVTFQGESAGTYAGAISGTGAVKIQVDGGSVTFTGTNTYSGGTLVESGVLIGTSATLEGAIANNATVTFEQDTNGMYTGVISGVGSLEKFGAGNLTVTGTSTYGGSTNVAAGRLSVNGQLGNTMVTVQTGAELGGSGSISGDVAILTGGTLSPGNSIASLAVGATTFSADSTFEYEYDSSAPLSVGADLLVVSGSLSIESGALITLKDLAGTSQPFENGTTFALINYSGVWNGGLFTFDGNSLADGERFFVGSQGWEIDYNRLSAVGLVNYTGDYLPSGSFVAIKAVPEPSTWALALAGIACGGYLVRRRKRA